jgi:hypothetical protein
LARRYWYTTTGALDCVTPAARTDQTCKQLGSGAGNDNLITD